jgi:hypothetical protein
MGMSAFRRKAWEKNPRREGRLNLICAVIFVFLYFAYNLIWGDFSYGGNVMCVFVAGWGVISFIFGELLHRANKKI